MKNKTLQEVYKNASDEVKEILKSKFDNVELGIKCNDTLIRNELLNLIKNNIKNIEFFNEEGNHINVPSNRFVIYDEDGDWLFEINYNEENKYFYYSYYNVYLFFCFKYKITVLRFSEILKGILEEELNLMGVTPKQYVYG